VANYAVVLPESKLAFRGTDALRLDAVTLLSLSVLLVQVSGVSVGCQWGVSGVSVGCQWGVSGVSVGPG
jgi:hypothetical protein